MKRRIGWILGGLVAYVIALVATVPITQALPRAAALLEARGIRLVASGLDGSVWSGRAAAASVNGLPLGPSEWSLSPWRLLIGEAGLDFKVKPEGGDLAGEVRLGSGHFAVAGIDGQVPAGVFLRALPVLPLPVEVEGAIVVNIEQLAWSEGKLEQAAGTILWSKAAVVAPTPVRLGDLRIELSPGPNGDLVGKLGDGGGPLGITGDVTLSKGNYRLNAVLTPRAGAEPTLTQALTLLGKPDSKGGYRVTWAGKL